MLTNSRTTVPTLQSALCDLCLTLLDQHDPRYGPSVYLSNSLVRSLKLGFWNTVGKIAYFTDQFVHKCTEMSQSRSSQLPYIEGFFLALLDGMNGFICKVGEEGLAASLSSYNEVQASIQLEKDSIKREPGVRRVPKRHIPKHQKKALLLWKHFLVLIDCISDTVLQFRSLYPYIPQKFSAAIAVLEHLLEDRGDAGMSQIVRLFQVLDNVAKQ